MLSTSMRAVAGIAALSLGACACQPKPMTAGGAISTVVGVAVTPDGAGGYAFRYSGDFAKENGDLDFSGDRARGRGVSIEFKIGPGSPEGLRFKSDGSDAMWIVEKKQVGDGSPKVPYRGDQFTEFSTSGDGQTLRVYDRNNDGVLYRYALRFDLGGETVQHDPDTQNGQGGNP